MSAVAGDHRRAGRLLRGQDGVCFQADPALLAQICEATTLDRVAADRLALLFEARFGWCALRDIRHAVLVVPDKLAVYADKLEGAAPSAERPIRQILARLAPRLLPMMVYPLEQLLDGRARHETYLRTDQSWSPYGAYLGYRALAEAVAAYLPITPIQEAALQLLPQRRAGDLSPLLPEAVEEKFPAILTRRILPVRTLTLNPGPASTRVSIIENDNRRLPRLVMFRDTGERTGIEMFLAAHFSRIVMVSGSSYFLHDLVRAESPDLVISELAEATLAPPPGMGGLLVPDPLLAPDFTALTGLTLPLSAEQAALA